MDRILAWRALDLVRRDVLCAIENGLIVRKQRRLVKVDPGDV
jgi:hypothetical protein